MWSNRGNKDDCRFSKHVVDHCLDFDLMGISLCYRILEGPTFVKNKTKLILMRYILHYKLAEYSWHREGHGKNYSVDGNAR